MARFWWTGGLMVAGLLSLGAGAPVPTFYVSVQSVTDPAGVESAVAEDVKRLFVAQLKRRGEITLVAPANGAPGGPAMKTELKRPGMRAYDASIKIQSIVKRVTRAPEGGRALELAVRLQIFGNTVPDQALKIGGIGAAGTIVRLPPTADPELMSKKVLPEVFDAAIKEAIEATLAKIAIVAPVR
jgi:hypothetical protein